MLYTSNMAKYLYHRSQCLIKSTNNPLKNITRTTIIPNAVPIPENNLDKDMLRNLRIAVSPSYGHGSNSYATNKCTSTSTLAGDPKRLSNIQDIRAEILEKWVKRPQPDIHKEWLKNIMFN
ncbi:uncharacterized protein LOC113502776 [Trichoplusia ni]|uniref:Uncharacterized protein LOC113502776 n=1 Tax=Trichoplusia ni TaxID=7111 RepID=A0A7E5WHS9_TRINI|nr:uncharacterized protein LOC113502776 [Trichoplusia ni]